MSNEPVIHLKEHVRYSIGTAAIVGVILTFINHYQVILDWSFQIRDTYGWSLNFVVPFTVSFYSRIMSDRRAVKRKRLIYGEKEQLKEELEETKNKLQDYIAKTEASQEEERKRNWAAKGLAEMGQVLRTDDVENLFDLLISKVVKTLKVNQGGIFITSEAEDRKVLQLKAAYAFDRKKYLKKEIEIGQGLVGQCYVEKHPIHLREIPDNYLRITSGLGDASPKTVFIQPLLQNNVVEGVLELGSFRPFETHELEFLQELATMLAGFISGHRVNQKTKNLLEESQEQSEILKSQEEEMRQNMEELEATQENMRRKELEMESLLGKLKLGMVEKNLKEITLSLGHGLKDAQREINFLADVPPISGMIRALNNNGYDEQGKSTFEDWLNRFIDIVSNLMQSKSLYRDLALMKNDQECLFSAIFRNGEIEKIKGARSDCPFIPYFKEAATSRQKVFVGEPVVRRSGDFNFVLAVPVFHEGKLEFILFISLVSDQLLDLIRSKEDEANRYVLTDSHHRVLYKDLGQNGYNQSLEEIIPINSDYQLTVHHFAYDHAG